MELEIEPAHFIWCHDLDKFIQPHLEAFERDNWRVMDAEDEYHNGTCVVFNVGPDELVDDWEDQNFNRWLMGGEYLDDPYNEMIEYMPNTRAVMQWLFENGKVPAGKYVVHIWW